MINMLIANALIFVNLNTFAKKILLPKYSNYMFLLIGLIGTVLLSFKNYPLNHLLGTFIMIVYYVFFVFFLFHSALKTKLIVCIFFILILSISEILSANLINILFNLNAKDINESIYTLAILLSAFIAFVLLTTASKIISLYLNKKIPYHIYLIIILPLTTILFLFNLSNYFSTFRNNVLGAFVILGLLISNFITIFISYKIINTIKLENDIKKINIKYESLELLYKNNFNFLHNMIKELMSYSNLLSNKNYKELSERIVLLNTKLLHEFNRINSNSKILSTLINRYIEIIQINNINIKTVIEYNDFSFLDFQTEFDIFSTLIKISIINCLKIKDKNKLIIIKTKEINNQIFIQFFFPKNKHIATDACNDYEKLREITYKYNGDIYMNSEVENYMRITLCLTNNNK